MTSPASPSPASPSPSLPTLPFGRTGHTSTRLIFGAAALGGARQDFADRVLEQVRAAGMNHLDTAASYGDSELRLAPFLATHRREFFLATKTGERSGAGARGELERSLERLGVDSVDLIQLHNLVEEDDWRKAFAPDGAVAALAAAQHEGLVRHIGVTGHGLRIPRMHLRSLDEFPFASVLFPLNHPLLELEPYRDDVVELLDVCASRGVAAQTIKSVARRRWLPDATSKRSWYEPLDEEGAIGRAVRFVLSHPTVFLNTSSDARVLAAVIDAASRPDATVAPAADVLAADRALHDMAPLFDGASLERI